jgi:membrane peptidoglycan carboxypeptidase
LLALAFFLDEVRSSERQARFFSNLAKGMTYDMREGEFQPFLPSPLGPYDKRLGYAFLPEIAVRLEEREFRVVRQARVSEKMHSLRQWGLFPVYPEKSVAGLKILDQSGEIVFSSHHPKRAFESFSEIPPLVVDILLYIENRELPNENRPYLNPAVEWDRLARAILDKGIQVFDRDHRAAGGSTLATQIEKFRHSPDGVTLSSWEKIYQMATASLRSYLYGEKTFAARKEIILSYLNSVPLAARADYGEVIGLGEGLWAWYGSDFRKVMEVLGGADHRPDKKLFREKALALKQVLGLFIAQRRPSYHLVKNPQSLNRMCDKYLRLLAKEGIISAELKALALKVPLAVRSEPLPALPLRFFERKATNAIRTRLMNLMGVENLYDLDRLDLAVTTTLDRGTQVAVTEELLKLHDPQWVSRQGLMGFRLLEKRDPANLIYSFILCEKTPHGNKLRVQSDNYDQPLDINEGVKLDLGSTAKLRTLITYLEIIANLHDRYARLNRNELSAVEIDPEDNLSRWAISHLLRSGERSLRAMLEAAMERTYSASPYEAFFTGGGLHTFENFNKEDNHKVLSVRRGFKYSVNLVFIRLMKDIVDHYLFNEHRSTRKLLRTPDHPERRAYLEQFADYEGSNFIRLFFRKYSSNGRTRDQVMEKLAQSIEAEPSRLSAAYFFVSPGLDFGDFRAILRTHLPGSDLGEGTLRELFRSHSARRWTLAEASYAARLHPLDLWVAAYLYRTPLATLEDLLRESVAVRQEVYEWLFQTPVKGAQNTRIRTILEIEAFVEIHQAWKRLGYPFGYLVPSLATAIGTSGDRPAALAELVGIIVNNGVSLPTVRVESLHFAEHTPYEVLFRRQAVQGEQVLRPEIALLVKTAMFEVVESGTAIGAHRAFQRPEGTEIRVGGKTGTGDHRYETFGPQGQLISSKLMNRTAVFVFFIDERFFGAITAFVPGSEAGEYGFTSSLPVAVFKLLAPHLMPLVASGDSARTPPVHPPAFEPG